MNGFSVIDCQNGFIIGPNNDALGSVVVKVFGCHIRVVLIAAGPSPPRNEPSQIARIQGLRRRIFENIG